MGVSLQQSHLSNIKIQVEIYNTESKQWNTQGVMWN